VTSPALLRDLIGCGSVRLYLLLTHLSSLWSDAGIIVSLGSF